MIPTRISCLVAFAACGFRAANTAGGDGGADSQAGDDSTADGSRGDGPLGDVPNSDGGTTGGPTSFDNATAMTGTTVGSLTWSHTVSSNNGRLLIVGVSMATPTTTVTTVRYAGADLTFVAAAINGVVYRVETWSLVAPPPGVNDVVVTLSGIQQNLAAGAASYIGVNQTSPFGTAQTATGSGTAISVNLSSAVGQLLVDVTGNKGGGSNLSVGSNQTQRYQMTVGTGGSASRLGSSTRAGAAGTVPMTWSLDSPDPWGIVAVPLRP